MKLKLQIWQYCEIPKIIFYYITRSLTCSRSWYGKIHSTPGFHSFAGCDTTSGFFGRGKRMAWDTRNCCEDVTRAFMSMALNPYADVTSDADHFQLLERFTVLLYNRNSDLEHVNDLRKELFCQKLETMETLPQPRIHSYSTWSELHTKVEYGAAVINVYYMYLPQKAGVGLLIKTLNQGFLYGTCYLWPPTPAVNLWNAAARVKMVVEVDANARRRTGSARNFVAVTVKSEGTRT